MGDRLGHFIFYIKNRVLEYSYSGTLILPIVEYEYSPVRIFVATDQKRKRQLFPPSS
jgi:hypothetical protein